MLIIMDIKILLNTAGWYSKLIDCITFSLKNGQTVKVTSDTASISAADYPLAGILWINCINLDEPTKELDISDFVDAKILDIKFNPQAKNEYAKVKNVVLSQGDTSFSCEMQPQIKNKKYFVTMKISAQYIVEVVAPENTSNEDIISKANNAFFNADFGEAKNVDRESLVVEDEKGNYICLRHCRSPFAKKGKSVI